MKKNEGIITVHGIITKIERKEIPYKTGDGKMLIADVYLRNDYSYTKKIKEGKDFQEKIETGTEELIVTAINDKATDICTMHKDGDYVELECQVSFSSGLTKLGKPYYMQKLNLKNIKSVPTKNNSDDDFPF